MRKVYRPYYPDEELLLPPSLREWLPEKHLVVEDIAFRVLAAGNQPNFRAISDFRKVHLKTLEGLMRSRLDRGARPIVDCVCRHSGCLGK